MGCTETVDFGVHIIALRGIGKQSEELGADDQGNSSVCSMLRKHLKSDAVLLPFVARNGACPRR